MVVVVGILVVWLGAWLYLRSDAFQQRLTQTLSELSGGTVVLDDRAELTQLFPTLRLSLPNARLQSTRTVARARIEGLELDASLSAVISGGRRGSVGVEMTRLDAIMMPSARPNGSVPTLKNTAPLFRDAMESIAAITASVRVQEMTIINRDESSHSTRWQLDQLTIETTGDGVVADADIAVESHKSIPVILRLSNVTVDEHHVDINVAAELQGSVGASAEARIRLTEHALAQHTLDVQAIEILDESVHIDGQLSLVQKDDHASLTGTLGVNKLSAVNAYKRAATLIPDTHRDRVFSYTPFNWWVPANLDTNVQLHLGDVSIHEAPFIGGTLVLRTTEGELHLQGEDLDIFNGKGELELNLDTKAQHQLAVALRFEGNNIDLQALPLGAQGSTIFNRGTGDMIVAARGAGPSPGHISASLDGYVIATADDAEFNRQYTTAIDRGLVSWAFERMRLISSRVTRENTGARLSDPLAIDCASLQMYINDGQAQATNGIVLELPDNTLYSSGYVDLKTENIGFAFRTRRKSLFDWSAISIVKYVEIGGSLQDANIGLNERELVKQGILSASSAAWGPLPSLVYSLGEAGLRSRTAKNCRRSID